MLKKDEVTGVLGYGQGVAPDVGLMDELGQGDNKITRPLTANGRLTTGKYGLNSVGKAVSGSLYKVNPLTGEGHWNSEWVVINDNTRPRGYDGTEIGEVTEDKNYYWNGMTWVLIAGLKDTGILILK